MLNIMDAKYKGFTVTDEKQKKCNILQHSPLRHCHENKGEKTIKLSCTIHITLEYSMNYSRINQPASSNIW